MITTALTCITSRMPDFNTFAQVFNERDPQQLSIFPDLNTTALSETASMHNAGVFAGQAVNCLATASAQAFTPLAIGFFAGQLAYQEPGPIEKVFSVPLTACIGAVVGIAMTAERVQNNLTSAAFYAGASIFTVAATAAQTVGTAVHFIR